MLGIDKFWIDSSWGGPTITAVVITDAIAVNEALSSRASLNLYDSGFVTETVSSTQKAFVALSDGIPINESIALSILKAIALTDTIPIAESPGKVVYQFGGTGTVSLYYAMVDEIPEL